MMTQVVPMLTLSNATDPNFWAEQGWKGALITIALLAIGLAVWKDKIGLISIGPSEAGIREFCGVRLWRVGPGLHPNVEGLWKVRMTSVARIKVRINEEVGIGKLTWSYGLTVWLKVADTKAALLAQIYTAQDLNRENMENSEAVEQATDDLTDAILDLLETGTTREKLGKKLIKASRDELLTDYGYEIVKVKVRRLVKRPQSELAEAIANGSLSAAVLGAVIDSERPNLEVLPGGSAQAADAH